MTEKMWFESLTVGQLLKAVRFAPAGDPRFQGAVGELALKHLAELRKNDPLAYIEASKRIGWG